MKRGFFGVIIILAPIIVAISPMFRSSASAAFNQNRIIDDSIFNNTSTMNATSINSFLNGFPTSCISTNKGFSAPDPTGYSPGGGFTYGGNASAGQVIYDASVAYGLNPQVLITTLQKEQGLVTGSGGCSVLNYAAAAGYGCPDGGTSYSYTNVDLYTINGNTVTTVNGTCVNTNAKVGFSQQVVRAAWLLRFAEQRSEGNIGWNVQLTNSPETGDVWNNSDDSQSCYSGPMTQGTWQICPSGSSIYYDGYTTIDGSSIQLLNGATAALYYYTPHFSGNENFYNIFSGWFGSPISGSCLGGNTSVEAGVEFDQVSKSLALPVFMIYSGSGSGCIEAHTWNSGYTSWQSHVASNQSGISLPNSEVLYGNLDGSGDDYPILFGLAGTGSGMVESHVWSRNMQSWLAQTASNLSVINPANDQIIMGDLNGQGYDQPIIVAYQNTGSGMIELHGWGVGMQSWLYHTITNRAAIDPTQNEVEVANLNGQYDQAVLVAYQNTGSGYVEFHIWNPGEQSWQAHIVSNLPVLTNPSDYAIEFADVDGNGKDQAVLVALRNTGSGMIEFHIWNPGEQSWQAHIVSNQPELPN